MSQATASLPESPESVGRAHFGPRHVVIIVGLLWAAQLLPMIGLIGGNAQAQIAQHFHTTQIAWFTLTGTLTGTFVTPFVVKAAAMYGKKRMLLVVAGCGFVGDIVAASAANYSMLLVGRGIAGIYAPVGALAYAMARDVFPPRLVGPASGLLGGGTGLVALGGPFLSGWLIDTWHFRGALWFMAVATALSFLLTLLFIPESPVREERTRMDWLGGLLLGGGLTAVVYGIGQGTSWGWADGRTLGCITGGVLAVLLFLVMESRLAHPMFSLALLRRRSVWSVFLVTSIAAAAAYSLGVVMQLLTLFPAIPTISDGLGWSATKNAVVTSPMSVLIVVAAVMAGLLARKVDSRYLLAAGILLAAIGYGLGSRFHHSVGQFMIWGPIGGVGMGVIVAMTPIMVIEAVSPEEQALGNGGQNMALGVMQALITQLAFVAMARHGRVLQGIQFYTDAGFSDGYWLVTGFLIAAAALVPLIPRVRRLDDAVTGQASAT